MFVVQAVILGHRRLSSLDPAYTMPNPHSLQLSLVIDLFREQVLYLHSFRLRQKIKVSA